MNRIIPLTLGAVWACGDTEPENAAPEICGDPIADQTVAIGESVQVQACFEDPDGDAVTIMAMSSDGGIARPSLPGRQIVDVSGLSIGKAIITVTGSDPDGLKAETTFNVEVPNRPPEATTPLPDLELGQGEGALLELDNHFADPDGQDLSYEASSSDSLVTLPAVLGDTLLVVGLLPGKATVAVTATDPDGETASQSADVQVSGSRVIFSHDFQDLGELDDWESQAYADLSIEEGWLHVRNDSVNRAWAYRDLRYEPGEEPSPHIEFVTHVTYDEGAEIAIHMRQAGMQYLSFGFGDSIPFDKGIEEEDTVWVDYAFSWYPSWPWRTHEDLWGRSDLIPDPGEDFTVRFVLDGTDILIEVDGEPLLDFDLADYASTAPDKVRGAILGIWPREGTDKLAVFDDATLIKHQR